jgi:RNA polymerase sigma factor (sigma-70 family)
VGGGVGLSDESDEALVLACREGREDAWAALIHRYRRLVYAVPRRAGLDQELASDIFQRVFTILLEKLDKIEQPDRISAWLVTTAKRESWRAVRQNTLRSSHHSPAPITEADEPPDGAALPEEVLLQLEEQNTVRMALESLDSRCRTLLDLLFYRPVAPAYEEIASVLGMREGSIGPIRARCLERLRRLLERSTSRA